MINIGWKTVLVQERANLSFDNGCLSVETDSKHEIPINQIKIVVIESLQVSITSYLLNELKNNHVKVILCDDKHMPSMELVPYYENCHQTACIRNQIQWDSYTCDRIWKSIVEAKILMQINLLQLNEISVPQELVACYDNVEFADASNREGQAAKLYFKCLFGSNFIRHSMDDINVCLNYGYSLLLANICRKITSMGYITNLGVKHHGQDNPYNLACDLMEPFRPFIDRVVSQSNSPELKSMKKALIESLYSSVIYNGNKLQLHNALDMFVEDVIRSVNDNLELHIRLEFI